MPSAPERSQPTRAVVRVALASLLVRPDAQAPVATQAVLGTTVAIRGRAPGFSHAECPDGYLAWIPEAAVAPWPDDEPNYGSVDRGPVVEVVSLRAHLYPEPSFKARGPVATVSLGTRLEAQQRVAEGGRDGFRAVRWPGGGAAHVAAADVRDVDPNERAPRADPAAWIALGMRLLEVPYTWGGTTPEGFDCSGFVQFLLARHGIVVKRDACQQCDEDPRLVPVELGELATGDLLFFGDDSHISHVALSIGEGRVLEATSAGRPGTKVARLDDPKRTPPLRCARRLRDLTARR